MAISLAVAAIIGAALAAAGSATAAGLNYKSQQDANIANAKAIEATNAQSQYNMEHAHQIEMADLKAAGLNPVLTATGGQGAPMASLNAPRAVAPELDLSGVTNALQSMTHMMMMSQLIDAKVQAAEVNANARNEVADKYIAAGRVRNLHKYESTGSALLGNAKQIKKVSDEAPMTEKEFKKMMKLFENR